MKNLKSEISENAFFALVRSGLWETEVQLASYGDLDISEVSQIAHEQAVVGLVAAGIEHLTDVILPKADILPIIGETMQLERRNEKMNEFVASLVEKLHAEAINSVLVKGQGIAQCYERPLWRASGDVDFLLSENDYQKAKAFLLPLGIISEPEEPAKRHFAMSIAGWSIELHGTLHSGLSRRIDRVLDDVQHKVFFEGKVRPWAAGNTLILLPAAEEDVVYVFTHILQHFYKGGIGLRQICDWCRLLWAYRDKFNLKLLGHRIQRMGLMSQWKAFGAFAVEYLGMPVAAMPLYSAEAKWKRKAERICRFVMEVGNMGHNRDKSRFEKKTYIIRKASSLGLRFRDSLRHFRAFPLDSLRFFPIIVFNGLGSALRGE